MDTLFQQTRWRRWQCESHTHTHTELKTEQSKTEEVARLGWVVVKLFSIESVWEHPVWMRNDPINRQPRQQRNRRNLVKLCCVHLILVPCTTVSFSRIVQFSVEFLFLFLFPFRFLCHLATNFCKWWILYWYLRSLWHHYCRHKLSLCLANSGSGSEWMCHSLPLSSN